MSLQRNIVWKVVGVTMFVDGRAEVSVAIYKTDSDFALGVQPIGMDKVAIPPASTKSDKDAVLLLAEKWVGAQPPWSGA